MWRFRVQSGFRLSGLEFRVFEVQDFGLGFQGFGLSVV